MTVIEIETCKMEEDSKQEKVGNNETKVDTDKPKTVRSIIQFNSPIEEKLHVIAVHSNPCSYRRREQLMHEFISRMESEINVILYVVELVYGDQPFAISFPKERLLQLRTEVPLWHKENMINLGVQQLLPAEWKAFAWIDADLEFESETWATDTLRILNGGCDIVQLFSHAVDMDANEMSMRVFNSAGYMSFRKKPYATMGADQWHPGFAWAITRSAYEKVGGLYQDAILGSGDNLMMLSLIGECLRGLHKQSSEDYKQSVLEYQMKMRSLIFGYTPGVIRHHFHGSKKNRKYHERWMILVNHHYQPTLHLTKDRQGLIVPSLLFPDALKTDILTYFMERLEDDVV